MSFIVNRVFGFALGRAASRRARAPAAELYWRARRLKTRKVNICSIVSLLQFQRAPVLCSVALFGKIYTLENMDLSCFTY